MSASLGLPPAIAPADSEQDISARSSKASCQSLPTDFASFRGSEHLLRATTLGQCLSRAGDLFSSSRGDASTWGLSQPVKVIDAFLSHNWIVPRYQKFLALSLHFNLSVALVLTLLFGLPFALFCEYVLPVWHLASVPDTGGIPIGWINRLFGVPMFLLILLFWRSLASVLGLGGPRVFLDKVCIHQEDETIQKNALSRLAAFLRKSKTMVVLYTDVYLSRLWTIYELGSYINLRPLESIAFVPVAQVKAFFFIILMVWFMVLLQAMLQHIFHGRMESVTWAICLVVVVMLQILQRTFQRTRAAIVENFVTFSVRNCECSQESDRQLLYSNITSLMVARTPSLKFLREEEILAEFDEQVKRNVPELFEQFCGRFTFRYRQYIAFGFVGEYFILLDHASGYLRAGAHWTTVLGACISAAGWVFGIWPSICMCIDFLASWKLDWKGWRQLLYTSAVALLVAALLTLADSLSRALVFPNSVPEALPPWRIAFLASLCLLAALLPVLLLKRRFCRRSSDWSAVFFSEAEDHKGEKRGTNDQHDELDLESPSNHTGITNAAELDETNSSINATRKFPTPAPSALEDVCADSPPSPQTRLCRSGAAATSHQQGRDAAVDIEMPFPPAEAEAEADTEAEPEREREPEGLAPAPALARAASCGGVVVVEVPDQQSGQRSIVSLDSDSEQAQEDLDPLEQQAQRQQQRREGEDEGEDEDEDEGVGDARPGESVAGTSCGQFRRV